ncbi:hypothetical protein AB3S75_045485 [Citrus x aurantiifolia]
MIVSTSICACAKNVVNLGGRFQGQMGGNICGVTYRGPSSSCCFYLCSGQSKKNYAGISRTISSSSLNVFQPFQATCFSPGLTKPSMKMRLLVPNQGVLPKLKPNAGPIDWPTGCASAGLICGLLVCYSSSKAHAEAADEKEDGEEDYDLSNVKYSHGKKVYTDYSVIGIPGDGRCLFRAVAHGACLRAEKPAPSVSIQRELADDLRAKVADEFIKRREETEWFIEGDFDLYVSQIRKPHVWGGEPELLMASHVLRMPITVYMHDKDAGGLISIAEYGQEYGKEKPIRVLYHGFGHYDSLQILGHKGGISKL